MNSLNKLTQYSNSFVQKTIGLLLTNKKFLLNIFDALDIEYFEDNSANKWIIEFIQTYFKKYHTTPSLDVLVTENKKIPNDVLKLAVSEAIKDSFKSVENATDLEYVEKEFSQFCLNQSMKKAILNSVNLLELGDYDGIKILVNNALKSGEDKNIGHEYDKDIESRYRNEEKKKVPFPWSSLNEITDGGLGAGDLGLIFGGNKMGKSWFAIDIAGWAIKQGYKVAYYTLELSEYYVGKRLDAYLTGIPLNKLDINRKKVEEIISQLPGKVIIKEFSAGKASLNTIENHLDKLKHNNDFEPELIVIDYLDLLKNKKSRKNIHEDEADIYTEARGLAKEIGVPLISPSQMGRGSAGDDITDPSKISGAYKKLMIADFSMGLARKRKDKINGTGRITILGNRNGPDGMVFDVKMDTTNGFIEINNTPRSEDDEGEEFFNNDVRTIDKDDKEYLKNKFLLKG